MATYTLTSDPNIILRDEDNAFIPADPANRDYQRYLAWQKANNVPARPRTPGPAKPKVKRHG